MQNYAGFDTENNEIPLLAFFAAHAPAPSEAYISQEITQDKRINPYDERHLPRLRSRLEIEIDFKYIYAATMIKRGKF